jgi:tungstate transport system ATP-binding protein
VASHSRDILNIVGLKLSEQGRHQPILRVDQLTLKDDTFTVVMGPNGAGKSLFLQLLQGLIQPTKGKIVFGIGSAGEFTNAGITMVMQRPQFLRRSVEQNIKFILNLNKKKSVKSPLQVLKRFDLIIQKDQPANQLSGGEKQRLALALAICKDPMVLLLDEPTASADPQTALIIEKILQEEFSLGRKLILVTHDVAQAKRLGQDIVFIYKGEIIEQKNGPDFFSNPKRKESKQFLRGDITL